MTDICNSLGMPNQFTFIHCQYIEQKEVCVLIAYLLFWMDLLSFSLKTLCLSK